MTLFSLGEVSRLLNVAPYRITYAISVRALPDASVRFTNKRCFTQEDVVRIEQYFQVKNGGRVEDGRATKGGECDSDTKH